MTYRPTEVTAQRAFELAVEHHRSGRFPEAESLYRQIIRQQPQEAAALYMLGILTQQTGRAIEAIDLISRALALQPRNAEWHNTLAISLIEQNRIGDALKELQQAVTLRPDFAEAFYNLGTALQRVKDIDRAIAAYRQAIALRPNYPEAWNNLANNLVAKGELDDAAAALRQSIQLLPQFAEAYYNLGCVLYDQGKVQESTEQFERAISMRGNFPEAHCSLGSALLDLGQWDQAIIELQTAIRQRPDDSQSKWNLANLLLLQGDLRRGFNLYEIRWINRAVRKDAGLSQPLWDGSYLNGRRILLRLEQGFGDMIQFIRYAKLVAARGGRVVVAAPPVLHRLLQGQLDIEQIVAPSDPLPEFDVHYPIMSLPALFGTTLETIPGHVPYLTADPALAATWRDRLRNDKSSLKIGLVWSGSGTHRNDRSRSFPLSIFAQLAEIAGVSFYSLQKGDAARDAQSPPAGMHLIDLTDQLNDFADTAALISELDLIIECDTSVAHLAGALGKPVWVLLSFAPDWRWMLDRSDSPWYPTMRLYRQPRLGDWAAVVEEISRELRQMIRSKQG